MMAAPLHRQNQSKASLSGQCGFARVNLRRLAVELRHILPLLLLSGSAFAADHSPRLAGIVVGPASREAIFTDDTGGSWSVVREGEAIGTYTVQSITSGSVLVLGPSGIKALVPEPTLAARGVDSSGAALPPAEAGAFAEGQSVGGLATRRDACVRLGLLPESGPGAGAQLRAMMDAMADLPLRQGEGAVANPPVRDMATAMRLGWEAAQREDARISYDAALCARVSAEWTQSGARYGFR